MSKLAEFFLKSRHQPWFYLGLVPVLVGLLAWAGPEKFLIQFPVIIYKLLLPFLGGAVLLFAWLALFPPLNPTRYLVDNWRDAPDSDVSGGADFRIVPGYHHAFCSCALGCALVFSIGALSVGLAL